MSPLRPTKTFTHFILALPAKITDIWTRYVPLKRGRRVEPSQSSGIMTFLVKAVVFGAMFTMLDEGPELDIMYRAFGIDVLLKTTRQKEHRKLRRIWREAKASGNAGMIRDAFFQMKRAGFERMAIKYFEEPMKNPWDMGRPNGLLDPKDVRVFFILTAGSTRVVGKIHIAFNVDRWELGVQEKIDKTTKWILTTQVQMKQEGGILESPCKLERAYRDQSQDEHELSRDGRGSRFMADAWDRRRTIHVAGE
ncbi:hypothetical protein Daus18300_014254 [Diaporthe australafricana]|uniref:Uncharacterized protein n=1 Tax=Diaporthe australafricana TaxID=127596 RepID=A0ABR3VVW2_9PEZI